MNRKRYAGCPMNIYGHIVPGAATLASWTQNKDISRQAKQRLTMIDWHKQHNNNISLTARHFGLERRTVRKWLRRFSVLGIKGLNNHSSAPHRTRTTRTPTDTILAVVAVRRQNPCWSKYKLKASLRKQGIVVSESTIGRILLRYQLVNDKVSKKRKRSALLPKQRYPRDLIIKNPGDMIQMDTKHLVGIGGTRLYQFTAIDVLTKVRVISVGSRISSRQASLFLDQCLDEFSFPIKAIQTDNGSEFQKEFREATRKHRIAHYFIETRSPKQNSYVERSHLTDEQEFYQQGNLISTVRDMIPKIKQWQHFYNYTRPHQALNYLTPSEYFDKYRYGRLPTNNYIPMQTS